MGLYIEEFYSSTPYQIKIFLPYSGLVNAYLTTPIEFSTQSSWTDFAHNPFQGSGTTSSVIGAGAAAAGFSTTMGAFTFQKWEGTQPIHINFEVGFVGITDTFSEVIDPMRQLTVGPLPPQYGNPLEPPANVLSGIWCTIETNWLFIDGLLPVTANPRWDHTYDESGKRPISGKVALEFMTMRAMDQATVLGWFK